MQKDQRFISHISQDQLQGYISGTLASAARTELEEHMYCCKHCMEKYLSGIDELLVSPNTDEIVEPSEDFNQKVMQTVHSYMAQQRPKKKKNGKGNSAFKNKVVICYLIAASISLFLIWSGSLESIQKTTVTGNIEPVGHTEQIERNWDKDFSWLTNLWNKE